MSNNSPPGDVARDGRDEHRRNNRSTTRSSASTSYSDGSAKSRPHRVQPLALRQQWPHKRLPLLPAAPQEHDPRQ
eukprot:11216478-Lingulodinium_polyedra.AAC.1